MAKKKSTKKPRPKQYTVVGFYDGDDRPYMEQTMALTPVDAVLGLRPESDVQVVDVIAGHHCGLLDNSDLVRAYAKPQYDTSHYLKCLCCNAFVLETEWEAHDCQ